MNTRFFTYAIEIHRTGSITKAAQNLYMAQPNLSKALKELEEQLGYEIFERTSNGMLPTPKGYNFLSHAQIVLEQIEQMEAIGEDEENDVQQFRISIPRGSYIADAFTEFVAQLDHRNSMEITIHETNSVHAINSVAHEKFNMGIIRYQSIHENYFLDYIKNKHLAYETVWEFEYLAVMSKKHPLAEEPVVCADDLFQYIEISHTDLIIPYVDARSMERQEKEKEVEKHIYVYDRGCQFDLLTRIPTTYMWVSPLPQIYLEQYDLVQRKCKIPNNNYKDVLVFRKGYEPSELSEQFKEKLYASQNEVASGIYQ